METFFEPVLKSVFQMIKDQIAAAKEASNRKLEVRSPDPKLDEDAAFP
jgi:hypothetical protein